MVRFLTTTRISAELEDLIKNAKKDITLISPYIKVNQRLRDFIQDVNQHGVRFTIIYGKRDMRPEEKEWIDHLAPAEIGFVENLHAKCYLNENTAIITSMNLYEFSQQNNDEMAIQVDRKEDPGLYQEINDETKRLLRKSTERESRSPAAPENEVQKITTNGYCIRCHDSIPLVPDKPLCGKCYRNWARFANDDYPEDFCHRCGKENKTSVAKPLCLPCWRLK